MIKDSPDLLRLREEFKVYYDTHLHAKFAEMDSSRQRYLSNFWILFILMAVVLPLIIAFCLINFWHRLNFEEHFDADSIQLILAIIAGIVWILSMPNHLYRKKVKLNVMEYLIKFFGTFSYKHDYTISETTINQAKLFSGYNIHKGDDYFAGSYKDVNITISEEVLKHESGSGKGRRVSTVFRGIMVVLDMNKNFKGQTVVKKDGGWILNKFTKFGQGKRVELEDVEFEKKFEVFSDDQVEARYLLTTAFMERILRLRNSFHSKKIEFSFFDNKLFVAICTDENMFEPSSIFKSSTDYKSVEKVFDQFYAVFSIVDVLKLHEKAVL